MLNQLKHMQIEWKNPLIHQVFHSKYIFFLYYINFYNNFFKNSEQHKVRPALHCGANTKPLEKYNPTSYRNRLPLPDAKMPSKNSSQIELGERKYEDFILFI